MVPHPTIRAGAINECCGGLLRLSPAGDVTTLNATPSVPYIVADAVGNLYLIGFTGLERIPAGEVDPQPFLAPPQDLVIQVQIDPSVKSRREFTYDGLDRLIGATPAESYVYDPVGNRITSHRSGMHVVDAANQLLEDDQFTYSYDLNGNLTDKRSKADGSVTRYSWNSQDQLVRVDLPDEMAVEYTYDPFGRRIQKSVNAVVTKYIYDGEDVVAELDGSDNVTTTYVHGPGMDEPISMTRNGRTYTYHRDALGSITHITDESGLVVQRYEYDSYGNVVSALDPNFNQPYAYTSREFDSDIGLYYYRARYYDPRIGRFISEDPIHFLGGINFYRYVGDNPASYTDPLGLLDPCGKSFLGKTIYTPADYRALKDAITSGLQEKYVEEKTPDEIDLAARRLAYEISVLEANKLKDLLDKEDYAEVERLLTEIYKKIEARKRQDQAEKDAEREKKEKKCQ